MKKHKDELEGFTCCGKFWKFANVDILANEIELKELAICLVCGTFHERTFGQLSTEEIEENNPYSEDEYNYEKYREERMSIELSKMETQKVE